MSTEEWVRNAKTVLLETTSDIPGCKNVHFSQYLLFCQTFVSAYLVSENTQKVTSSNQFEKKNNTKQAL